MLGAAGARRSLVSRRIALLSPRPSPAPQYFNKDRRTSLKADEPNLSSLEVQTRLAVRAPATGPRPSPAAPPPSELLVFVRVQDEWRAMPAQGRAPYTEQAAADKARFESEMATYEPDPSMLKATKGGNRLQKDPMRPKKPKSAYLYFGEATRAELTGSNPGIRARRHPPFPPALPAPPTSASPRTLNLLCCAAPLPSTPPAPSRLALAGIETLSKLIGEEWKKLSDEAKAPYVRLAEDDQARYKSAMDSYTPSDAYVAAREAFKKAKKGGSAAAASSSAAAEDDDDEEEGEEDDDDEEEAEEAAGTGATSLAAENKELKRKIAALEKQSAKQQKQIDALLAKIAKADGKADGKAADSKGKEKAEGAKSSTAGGGKIEDPSHYYAWTKKVLGAKGEKADDDMLKILAAKGPKGLGKLLVKRYKAEHK